MWPPELTERLERRSWRGLLVADRRRRPRLRPRPPRSRRGRLGHRSRDRQGGVAADVRRADGEKPVREADGQGALLHAASRRRPALHARNDGDPLGVERGDGRARLAQGLLVADRHVEALLRHGDVTASDERAGSSCMSATIEAGRSSRLDPATGKEKWTTAVRGPGYASPIELTIGRCAADRDDDDAVGHRRRHGDRRAALGVSVRRRVEREHRHAHRDADGVIVSGVRQGTRRLKVAKSGHLLDRDRGVAHAGCRDVHELAGARARERSYGHSSKRKGQFVAMDPETGKLLWATEGRNATSASVVAAGNHLVFLTTESQMIVTPGRSRGVPARFGATPWRRARPTRSRSSCAIGSSSATRRTSRSGRLM